MLLGFLIDVIFVSVLACGIGMAVMLDHYLADLPDYQKLSEYRPKTPTEIVDVHGETLASLYTEYRVFAPIENVPDVVKNAFISAEDKNFFTHPGLDPFGIARAMFFNVKALSSGARMQGASTITQQVMKNFLLDSDRTLERKLKEAVLSLRFEQHFTKEKILELYLNQIYLGAGSYGVGAAARVYFGKSLSQLAPHEAAFLAALPKAPNDYHPIRRPDRAIARRNWVLSQMLENGFLDQIAFEISRDAPLSVRQTLDRPPQARTYFTEAVRRQLNEILGPDGVYDQGYKVQTSLDPRVQNIVEKSMLEGLFRFDRAGGYKGALANFSSYEDARSYDLNITLPEGFFYGWVRTVGQEGVVIKALEQDKEIFLENDVFQWARDTGGRFVSGDVILLSQGPEGFRLRQVPNLQGAVIVLNATTGAVEAMQGGFSFATSEFNRAIQAQRQPGSLVKPFVYERALHFGFTPVSIVVDGPIAIDQGPGLDMWKPSNYSDKFYGPTPLRRGIELSRNLMTVRVARDVGIDRIAEGLRKLGLAETIPPYYSAALGAIETTPMRLAAAFSTLARRGSVATARLIEAITERDGKVVLNNPDLLCVDCQNLVFGEQILDPLSSFQVIWMMRGTVERGTAKRMNRLGFPVAGKTGTSNEARDLWFAAITSKHVVIAYVGYDTPKPVGERATGGGVAAPIVEDVLSQLYADREKPEEFVAPDGIHFDYVSSQTGMSLSPEQGGIYESFKYGEGPNNFVPNAVAGERVEDGAKRFSGVGGLY